jgi:hypothetical protein
MSNRIPEYPDEALVRKADAPGQPAGTRWYTDCGNARGTAHLYVRAENWLLVAKCGRYILESDCQTETKALGYCKRCVR